MEEKSSKRFDSNEIETKYEKPLAARLGEGIFCIIYLVYTTALVFIMKGKYDAGIAKVDDLYLIPEYVDIYRYSFGFMLAAILVFGDAFHLIPRIIVAFRGSMWKQDFFLGLGTFISSITITFFYNVLIGMGDTLEYSEEEYNFGIEQWILYLTIIRLIIMFMPFNGWYKREPNHRMAVLRNIPFVFIGVLTVFGFLTISGHANNYPSSFYMIIVLMVILSFVFYLPVALHGKENPKLGMLMIPKTICYMILLSLICFY